MSPDEIMWKAFDEGKNKNNINDKAKSEVVDIAETKKDTTWDDNEQDSLKFQIVSVNDPSQNRGGDGARGLKGQVNTANTNAQKTNVWHKIQQHSDRIIQFVDLCGHEKYLKTTIFGLVGLCPDYWIVVVN